VSIRSLSELAVEVLATADPALKTAMAREHAETWLASRASGEALPRGDARPPDRPARPDRPELLAPRDVPRRRPGTPEGRIAMLHALAHIELNAVDLHWDIVARFPDVPMPAGFFDDWVRAGADEARHFGMICDRLAAMGSHYGALPAHAGMWRAAEDTAHDLPARLAIVPMVLEARGLDVTPGMIAQFRKAGDDASAEVLEVIRKEEVTHVAYGAKWFHFLCGRDDRDPRDTFHDLVRRHFHAPLRPPFDTEKRAEAGLPPDFYWPLADSEPPRSP
jgi:uncharacterized ferritin-like protein (DUF455 family)